MCVVLILFKVTMELQKAYNFSAKTSVQTQEHQNG